MLVKSVSEVFGVLPGWRIQPVDGNDATTMTALRRAIGRCNKGSNKELNVGVSMASTTGRMCVSRRSEKTDNFCFP